MTIRFLLFALMIGIHSEAYGQHNTPNIALHAPLDSLLQANVSPTGQVNYKNIKENREQLDRYCMLLTAQVPSETWSREAQMAYWINAYNAFTIRLIVDNYPTQSILRFDGGKTWDVKRIKLGDRKYSLNQIENEILRPQFKDARIHFAINCAAKSCPPLYNRAYTAENLEQTLDLRTREFVNNPQFNITTDSKLQLSRIFEWYAADFGNLVAFLNQYSNKKLKKNAIVSFQEYNWDLNQ